MSVPVIDRGAVTVAGGLVGPLILAAVLAPFRATLPAVDAALCLVLVVVAVAAGGSRPGGYFAAASAAAWFDFFFTRPYETFDISGRDNIETTILLLAIGVAITEIAVWGRREHLTSSKRAGYVEGLRAAAQVVATGTSTATVADVVCLQLTAVLSLRECLFQPGMAGIGARPTLEQRLVAVALADQAGAALASARNLR